MNENGEASLDKDSEQGVSKDENGKGKHAHFKTTSKETAEEIERWVDFIIYSPRNSI